jgi:hypothetical protein
MKEVLVVANRTLGGAKLFESVRERSAQGDARFRLVVPQTKPSAGLVIYDEAVREAAQVRVDLALSAVAQEGIEATGEVGDSDPFMATMDAVAVQRPDEIILSTYPVQHSGWLRRDLIERVRNASALPVEHIVSDIDEEGLSFKVTLVVAHKTSSGDELLAHLREQATDAEPRLFIAVIPLLDGSGTAPREARDRLASMLAKLQGAGLLSSGMIGDPDPYTATMNALELFHVDDVVISTLPGERSGWLRSRLIERVRGATSIPVEHVVVDPRATTIAASAA